jgi:DNA-binding transcriptional MerR regulator/catechol 2,3-dioxygenase-like lactoylglutathione lyase family enzyme
MNEDASPRLHIGEFSQRTGLSIVQLRHYDRLRLLVPAGRVAGSGYRYYTRGQVEAARVIALLRSVDMPIAEIRRMLSGAEETERRDVVCTHRARLEARLEEVRGLLEVLGSLHEEDDAADAEGMRTTGWLHLMPRLPVSDMERAIVFYEQVVGMRLDWRTADGRLAALSDGGIETLLLDLWEGQGPPPPRSAYVYVDDPDGLCEEYRRCGAEISDPVASRDYGMRDFAVCDPDGHEFRLGRGEETLREVADHYGIPPDRITVEPPWLERRRPGR